ncbi:MAG TPA: GDP-mannose 4,6-dehydratase [Methanomassiliicoccales archaeon]|jgi:UDP-glucose 4-epimerase
MKAVVTGGAGFIGSTLVDRLLDEGNDVVVVDNLDLTSSGRANYLEPHFENERYRLDKISVLDLDGLRQSVVGADVVFHLAAQANLSTIDPVMAQMEITGTLNVLLAAKNAGISKVISSSSASVYGNSRSPPVKETDPTGPTSPLGSGKLAAEEYCRLFHELYGLKTMSLRYFTVFGPRQQPNSTIGALTESVLSGRHPQIIGGPDQVGDYLFVSDAVEAILRCAHCDDLKGQALNVCSGRATTTDQLVRAIMDVTGRSDMEPEYLPGEDEEARIWGDNTWAKELLGWEPRIPLDEGLGRLVEWYEKSGT